MKQSIEFKKAGALMLEKNIVTDVLTAALSTGGSFAEVFIENTVSNRVSMVNNIVETALTDLEHGCGIRIFDGLNAVYAFTNDTSKENLIKIAKEAAATVKERKNSKVIQFDIRNFDNISPMSKPYKYVAKSNIVDMLRLGMIQASTYEKITGTSATYIDVTSDVLVANSQGVWGVDKRNRTRSSITAIASNGDEKQTASRAPGSQLGFEFYDNIDFKSLGDSTAQEALKMLSAGYAPGKKITVVIDNGFGGVIFHEACGHSLEATSIAKGASEFCGKLNMPIANSIVTAIDDGTMPHEWGSMNMDDEGALPQRNVLIENGVCRSYLIDKLNGLRMNMAPTGSGRRQNYRFAPTSRMTNTYIAPGNDKREDIIASTEYGLYAKHMGGGSVVPGTGEFNFMVLEAYMIRNGKIAEPVRGASLIGKGSEVLMNIDRISSDMTMESGMCGSLSGSIPTNVGQPMIRVQDILVGGRGQ